ncbi:MAG: glutaryl-7-ACA acylase, partial [Gluconacetobacter diazotrophicus]|nr:glutaryl-7-ACA acylase [Gluconacetobacter diazotrophicus]
MRLRVLSRAALSFGTALLLSTAIATAAPPPAPADPDTVQTGNDIRPNVSFPPVDADYTKRVVMIPMRDGVKLYTVIVIPKGAHAAPMILTRTPYDAQHRAKPRGAPDSPSMLAELPAGDDVFVRGGYIRVFQDIRGKYGSEGDYVMTRP